LLKRRKSCFHGASHLFQRSKRSVIIEFPIGAAKPTAILIDTQVTIIPVILLTPVTPPITNPRMAVIWEDPKDIAATALRES